ncbi:uncharacterized protein LOC124886635 [Capsicum annuum]|uniref:uncharacterized protein LOC124886635 n=1 Tax=Capsicum annuum TaxID=4072 RepID=UPI001FB13E2B|nr:uncharacterized protein LOC124886635 [Capsicum annuum]
MDIKVAKKKDDPEAFTSPCTIRTHEFARALYDLGASINLIPFVMYNNIRLNTPTWTSMLLLMEDRSIKSRWELCFMSLSRWTSLFSQWTLWYWILKWRKKVPIILRHPFLVIGRAIVDLEMKEMNFSVQEDEVSFKIYKSKKQTAELQLVSMVDVEDEKINEEGFEDPP